MQLFGALLLATALVASEAATASDDPPAAAALLQQQAEAFARQGRYADAEPLLTRALALLQSQLGADDPRLASGLADLADLYAVEGRYAEAEPIYKRALALRRNDPGPDRLNLGATLDGLAGLYKLEGRYAEAEALFRQALDIAEAAPDAPVETTATILTNLALIYQNEGRYDEAEPLYRRAISAVEKSPEIDRAIGSVIRNNLAGLYKEQGRYDEAERLYRSVLDSRETDGVAPLDLAVSLNNLASVYDAQARYAQAEPLLRRALKLREDTLGPDHPDVAQSLSNLAGIYWAEGDLDKAEPLLERALDIRQKRLGPDHPEIAAALNNIAALYWSAGRRDDALALSARAVAVAEAHLAANAGQNTAAAFAEYRKSRAYFANYVGIAYGVASEHPDRAASLAAGSFRVAQLAEATNTASAVSAMAARFAAGSDRLASVVREQQDAAARWRRLDGEIVALAAQPQSGGDPVKAVSLRASLAEARETFQNLDRKVAAEFPDYAALVQPKPIEAAAVEALLAPDEALLVYFATPAETWLWAVRHDGIGLFKVKLGARGLAAAVATLRASLTPDLPPYPVGDANALYDEIVSPASAQLTAAHRLIVVADATLQSLPFAILVAKKPAVEPVKLKDYRSVDWLARSYAVSVLPAVSSLPALHRSASRQSGRKPFLGIGDPVLAGTPSGERGTASQDTLRGAGADVRNLPALPETADELKTIAKSLGATADDLLLGGQASEPELRRAGLDRYRIIEFATHGLLSGELKGLAEPALVLTPPENPTPEDDGLLTASKIAGFKLDADWVVLSACNTAESDNSETGGWSALAQAFFYAGARSLLLSHWPVWSKATVALTGGIFRELQKEPGIGRAEALRRAEMDMLDPRNPPEFSHPFAWAPFVLAGAEGVDR